MRDAETGWVEADVTINGVRLSFAEAMTLRVAVSSFRMFVNNPESRQALGAIAGGYEGQLQRIESLMLSTFTAVADVADIKPPAADAPIAGQQTGEFRVTAEWPSAEQQVIGKLSDTMDPANAKALVDALKAEIAAERS